MRAVAFLFEVPFRGLVRYTDGFQPTHSRAPVPSGMEMNDIAKIVWGNMEKLANKCIGSTTRTRGRNTKKQGHNNHIAKVALVVLL